MISRRLQVITAPITRAALVLACILAIPLSCLADEPSGPATVERIPFVIKTPFKLSGEWRKETEPGQHPSDTRNVAEIQVLTFDPVTGAVTGTVDFYARKGRCGRANPMTGTFDGTTLRATTTLCNDRGDMSLEVWKEADCFHGLWGRRPLFLDAAR